LKIRNGGEQRDRDVLSLIAVTDVSRAALKQHCLLGMNKSILAKTMLME
jgi:hypothetical protein